MHFGWFCAKKCPGKTIHVRTLLNFASKPDTTKLLYLWPQQKKLEAMYYVATTLGVTRSV